jgi:hypothetical protein
MNTLIMEFLTIYLSATVPSNSLLLRDFAVKNKNYAHFKPHFHHKRYVQNFNHNKRYQHRTFDKDMSHQQRR